MSPEYTKCDADKSSGQMIWTNLARLKRYDTWMHRNQICEEIGDKLKATDWAVQDKNRINLCETLGIAVGEMASDIGPADCNRIYASICRMGRV